MNKNAYNPSEVEQKWQKVWVEHKTYSPDLKNARKPFYNLMMFPYPSAQGLHVGNMYAFTGSDLYGRFKRMQGFDVFQPIGLDGFGIHSENYAIKVGKHPKEQAKVSEANFYRQLASIGNGFDWEHKLETYDPNYYRWTQWIFIQLFKAGLAYRKKAPVNFCPSCKTVLADEQVVEAKCERCSSLVEKRDLEQWFFRITDYADRLLLGLDTIDWSEKVKVAQRAWIGRSEGAEIGFKVEKVMPVGRQVEGVEEEIVVYTVFPETIYGVTYMVLAPEHPYVAQLTTPVQKSHVAQYLEQVKAKPELERTDITREKTGVFTGSYCINPVTEAKIPIWIADYVIGSYGTGAVMGVPGSDHRDFAFARKYDLPVIQVVAKAPNQIVEVDKEEKVLEEGYLVNSGQFSGLKTPEIAREKIKDFLEEKKYGKRTNQYHLRDWLISRQRYWGPPIPMIYCEACASSGKSYLGTQDGGVIEIASQGPTLRAYDWDAAGWFPVPEDQLPVALPDVTDWRPEGSGTSPLANHPEFYQTTCPQCSSPARQETDVSDTFLDSAWYFLRYPSIGSATSERALFDSEITKKWLPVHMYIGGAEHAVLHLLYSRFITMVFHDLKLIDFEEPFSRFYAHGLIIKDGVKMSKSKGNVVVPDEYIRKYGADTLRSYLMFTGPYSMGGDFRDSGVEGMSRFLNRVYKLVSSSKYQVLSMKGDNPSIPNTKYVIRDTSLDSVMHKTIKAVTHDMEALRYNTAIAHLMEYYNKLSSSNRQLSKIHLETLVLLLAPFAPHMAEELFQFLNSKFKIQNSKFQSVHHQPWPSFDEALTVSDEVVIAVQINGKLRDTLRLRSGQAQSDVEELARSSPRIQQYLSGKVVKKTIYVPGKIINFVV